MSLAFLEVGGDGKIATVEGPHTGLIRVPEPADIPDAQMDAEASGREGGRAESCEHLLVMVGANHTLPPDYIPKDLVYLSVYGIRTRGSDAMLRQEVAGQLRRLISAAALDGEEVLVASGYRSYNEQKETFAWFKDTYREEAGKLSAPPGQSEHQLGTAVDFTSADVDYELVDAFARTSAGVWLADHAASYGFTLSYGKDQEKETGVGFEPWHYRYVGVDTALRIKAGGENLSAFLVREGVPRCHTS